MVLNQYSNSRVKTNPSLVLIASSIVLVIFFTKIYFLALFPKNFLTTVYHNLKRFENKASV